jgi:hypothetical protein
MSLDFLRNWDRKDKIIGIVAGVSTLIAVTYVLFILYDPYYLRPCPYYVSNCPENNAGYFMNWLSDEIHKIIPYAVAQATNSASNMTQYKDSFGRFSISYPNNWTATPATNRFETDVLTIHNDNPRTAFIVVQIQVVNNLPLDEFATAYRSGLYDWTVFQDTECTNYKIQGNTVCSFIITRAEDTLTGTPSLTSLIVMNAAGGKAYIINLGSPSDNFDSMMPTYNKIIDSFHIGSSALH